MKAKRLVKVDPKLGMVLDRMACAYGATRNEALAALWAADEIVVVNGVARLITPTKPDGRIAG